MRRRLLVACVMGVGLWGEAGPTARPLAAADVAAPGEQRITAEGLRRQLMFLASPELEGREATERGGRAAARFLAMQYAEAGLAPAGRAGPPVVRRRGALLLPALHGPASQVQPGEDVAPGEPQGPGRMVRTYLLGTDFDPGHFVGNLEVSGPLVFAGYGITAPEWATTTTPGST